MNKFKCVFVIAIALSVSHAHAQDTLRLRVMTYNLRFGQLATVDELAEQIHALKPDFVALQEVDVNTDRTLAPHQNGKNIISRLAGQTDMFGLFGKTIGFNKGYYGIGILSRTPYLRVNKTVLPDPLGAEPRVLLEGLFETSQGDTVVFAATHLDVTAEETRELQGKYITDYFKDSSYPVIIGGDFNALPDSRVIEETMARYWFDATDSSLTFPARNPRIKIDYLFALPKDGWKAVRTRTVPSVLSDHLPVITVLEYIKK